MAIKIGVIPAAGRGERMLPLTRAMPKEMLVVDGKPFIQYVVDGMVAAGVKTIYIITGWRKHLVLDYFGSGEKFGVDISYIVQDDMLGLADAIGRVRNFVDETFVVGLGDDIFYPTSCVKDIIDFHEKKKPTATLSIEDVPKSEVEKYGIVKVDKNNKVLDLIEKPKAKEAPSTLAIAGIYVFTPEIFDAIRKTRPGKYNELQLTDSIKLLVDSGKTVYAKKLSGERITIGSIEELRKANEFFVHMNSKKHPK